MAHIATAAGIKEKEARKVATQVRKGGPLHAKWKEAFSTGRFVQINGRPRKASANGRPALVPAVVVSKDIPSSSSSSATCVDVDENVVGAQFLSDVELDSLNMDDSALMDDFLFRLEPKCSNDSIVGASSHVDTSISGELVHRRGK